MTSARIGGGQATVPADVDETAFASVEEIATLVRSGQASAREVTEAALRRIEALDPALNAFIEVDAERALAAADALTPGLAHPFAGVPIAIKGNVPVEGMTLNYASASASACSAAISVKALMAGSSASMRRRQASTTSRALAPPLRMRAAISTAEANAVSSTLTGTVA